MICSINNTAHANAFVSACSLCGRWDSVNAALSEDNGGQAVVTGWGINSQKDTTNRVHNRGDAGEAEGKKEEGGAVVGLDGALDRCVQLVKAATQQQRRTRVVEGDW